MQWRQLGTEFSPSQSPNASPGITVMDAIFVPVQIYFHWMAGGKTLISPHKMSATSKPATG
jgi:hypothetical protein